ncbi:ATP-binding protein [Desulfovibrio inopinatus]|uniref:ATP-binding protein n=1 Tax=Desulfovibrio inopinatus TaxID=102109 RepID=UPI000427FEE3|nr:ATP-binding protein [Desulfovibrio inopinatus]
MPRLRNLLTWWFFGLAGGPLLALGPVLGWFAYNETLSSTQSYVESRASYAAYQIEEFLMGTNHEIGAITRYQDFFSLSSSQQRDVLLEFLTTHPMVLEVILVDKHGKELFHLSNTAVYSKPRTTWLDRLEFLFPVTEKHSFFGDISVDKNTGEPLMKVSAPLFDVRSGAVRMVAVLTLRLKAIWNLIAELSKSPNERVFVMSNENYILAHPDPSLALSQRHVEFDSRGKVQTGSTASRVIAGVQPIQLSENQYLLAVAERDVLAAMTTFFHSILAYVVIVFGTFCVAVFGVYVARRKFVEPIERLTETALAIQNGHLDAQAEEQVCFETDALACTFNAMTSQLLSSMRNLKDEVNVRLAMEAALRKSQERFDMALGAVSDGLWDWNMETGDVYYSERYATMLGYQLDDIVPNVSFWKSSLHPEDVEEAIACLEAHIRDYKEYEVEFRMRTKAGNWKWLLARGRVVACLLSGEPARMVGTHVDIDERKRNQESIRILFERTSETVGPDFFESVATLICQWLDFNCVLVAAVDEVGKRLQAMVLSLDGKTTHDFALPFQGTPYADIISQGVFTVEEELRHVYPVDVLLAEARAESGLGLALSDSSGDTIGILWAVSDKPDAVPEWKLQTMRIVAGRAEAEMERLRYERILREAKEHAEAASEAKSAFLANMSHELRTPLSGALGMLQLLRISELNETQQGFVNTAITSCRALTNLLEDLLDLSKIEAGKMELSHEPFMVEAVFNLVHNTFSGTASRKHIDFSCSLSPDIPEILVGDAGRLRQILFNLVGNAIKFTEVGEVTVEVSTLKAPAGQIRLLFCIHDSGIGISDEKLPAVFMPFFQADNSFTRRYQGAGLGLAVVTRLVKLMGGNLALESEEGVGTTVYLSLIFGKWETEERKALTPHPEGTEASDSTEGHILLVEDEPVNRVALNSLLKALGHTVYVAAEGNQALEIMHSQPVELILMDIQMPVLDGVEATKKIRSSAHLGKKAHIPIIAMTAYAMPEDLEVFLEAGMDDRLTKPIDFDALKVMVETYLQKSRKL